MRKRWWKAFRSIGNVIKGSQQLLNGWLEQKQRGPGRQRKPVGESAWLNRCAGRLFHKKRQNRKGPLHCPHTSYIPQWRNRLDRNACFINTQGPIRCNHLSSAFREKKKITNCGSAAEYCTGCVKVRSTWDVCENGSNQAQLYFGTKYLSDVHESQLEQPVTIKHD